MEYEKEYKKLEDLQWEYETLLKFCEDKAQIMVAFHNFKKQLNKVVKMQQEGKGNPDYKVAVDGV